jgi:alkanesulfonate monooxygenase SsuD/methylene tetrahydromethanopterin reductase-like flavin-dependent oxidoreductase (luciferase family)
VTTPTFGIAIPHYDGLFPQTAGRPTLGVAEAALAAARRAEEAGFHSVWVSDHLWIEPAPGDRRRSPDCWALLAAIAATTQHVRVGSLVAAAPLRPVSLLLHQAATVADLAPGRLDVGLGAGWNAAEYAAAGIGYPAVKDRLDQVEETALRIRAEFAPEPPPIWIGGKRTGILAVAARVGDVWNLAWDPTPEDFSRRLAYLKTVDERAAAPQSSVGLTTLIGTDEADLRRRWDRLRTWAPGDHLTRVGYDTWRQRGLIGTPDEVRARASNWAELGVTHIVCALGIPFGLFEDDQLDLLAATVLRF